MGASFIGYVLFGPKKLNTLALARAAAKMADIQAWANKYAAWEQSDTEHKTLRRAEEELYREGQRLQVPEEVLEEMQYGIGDLIRKEGANGVMLFAESWDRGDDEALSRDIPATENQAFTVGGYTWGGDPDSPLYKRVDLLLKLGILSELGIE